MLKRLSAIGHCLLTLLLLATGCATPRQQAATEMPPIDRDMEWQLVAIRGKEVKTTDITLVLNPEARTLHGQSACNSYSADYSIRNSEFAIHNLQPTGIQCPEADMLAEERYFNLLRKADAAVWTAYELTLFQHGKEILRYELK